MLPRPHSETIAVLRRTLLEVEQQLDPVADAVPLAVLKTIVLQRIAQLELERMPTLQTASGPASSLPVVADEDLTITDTAA